MGYIGHSMSVRAAGARDEAGRYASRVAAMVMCGRLPIDRSVPSLYD